MQTQSQVYDQGCLLELCFAIIHIEDSEPGTNTRFATARPTSSAHQQEGSPDFAMRPLPLHAQVSLRTHQVRLWGEDKQVCASAAHGRRTYW